MAAGPGKYDDLCTHVRHQTQAKAVIVIVLGGNQGDGFSVQMEVPAVRSLSLAKLLRDMAEQLEASGINTLES